MVPVNIDMPPVEMRRRLVPAELTYGPGRPARCPDRPAAASPEVTAAGRLAVPAGYGRVTGPLALMTWCHASGGLLCEHLPPTRAPMARMLSWYLPLPVIPA